MRWVNEGGWVKANLLIVDVLIFGLDRVEGDDGVFFVELKRVFEVVLHL